jgi:ABC-type transporter Mla maintaining outer membrane lipid asymmetry ATPase subunit MlaF
LHLHKRYSSISIAIALNTPRDRRRIADEVALLFGGKIMWRGAADKIDEVANPYIDQFIHDKLDGPIPVLGFGGGKQKLTYKPIILTLNMNTFQT